MNMPERNYHPDFGNLSDATLTNFIVKCQNELRRRAQEREEERRSRLRDKWVHDLYHEFCENADANMRIVGKVTIVAVYRWRTLSMATSTPVHGDVYNKETGIAVAYAKAMGYDVPDYI
jgi:hypothetical protein